MKIPEPLIVAYRVDLRSKKEFYSVEEAQNYFKCSRSTIYKKSKEQHLIGANWNIFRSSFSNKYIQNIIRKHNR